MLSVLFTVHEVAWQSSNCIKLKPSLTQLYHSQTPSALKPLSDRYFVFNFIEQPNDVESFKKNWVKAAEYVKDNPYFIATYLHSTTNTDSK